jgi:hypothetical protein
MPCYFVVVLNVVIAIFVIVLAAFYIIRFVSFLIVSVLLMPKSPSRPSLPTSSHSDFVILRTCMLGSDVQVGT